ncbi:flagellar filament capping protein FliD [Noviherbaspirillum aerium]|uniref:flagellar filament capping protein FliD n=1 Tax=Noviherbaspirillum aerium TaxID=2588497 RepID=UPI00124E68A3|nr:flagellar filament capping protein FliD [Noviherbaspirillum aerium]
MALSASGIGSNLDVNSIVQQLMQVESQPLTSLAKKEASYQSKLSAYGSLKGALSSFQSAIAALATPSKFQAYSASTTDAAIASVSANSQAVPGSYNLNITQLAQAQTLTSSGRTSATSDVGTGTITFQFGTISLPGARLSTAVASSGIAAGSLTINGTTIATSASTNSAKALAVQINLASATTGVTAAAQPTDTGSLGAFTTTVGPDDYSLSVGGVNIISGGVPGTDAAAIDTQLANSSIAGSLKSAGISFTGTAVDGTLRFTRNDGGNILIQESGAGANGGFMDTVGIGPSKVFTSSVVLTPANVTIGGSDPSLAGFTAGAAAINGIYSNSAFAQDALQASTSITIDNSNRSLQGIRDAINKASIGVTASIVSDGSAQPYRLVLTSNKTGETSSMKISVDGDDALKELLNYDPGIASAQKMTETSAAKNTALTVNGISITSPAKTLSDAIQGVTLNLNKTGSTSLTVSRDTNSVNAAVNAFVKAYNDIDKTLKSLTSYNAETKQGGILLGDSTARTIQTGVRQMMTAAIGELSGSAVNTLSDIGVAFQKDGTLAVDSTKLQKAVTNNFSDIAALFSAIGNSSDSLTSFVTSTSATKAGKYAVNITQPAERAMVTGTVDLNASPVTIASGTRIKLTLDDKSATVSLSAGSYTSSRLAAMLQSAINGTSAFSSTGVGVTVSVDENGHLGIVSKRYGSVSKVEIADEAGTSITTLLGAASLSDTGKDVAGTIGGAAATGSGQELTGAAGTSADGLKILIAGTSGGDRGTVTFSRGYADRLGGLMNTYVGADGLISSRTSGLNTSIKDIGKARNALSQRLEATEARYRAQFTALDTLLSSMNQTSSYLSQQLASLSSLSSS